MLTFKEADLPILIFGAAVHPTIASTFWVVARQTLELTQALA